MRRSLQRAVILSAGILVLGLGPLFGWGETADRLVTNRAVDTLPQEMQPFFYANRQFLVEHVGPAEETDPKTGTARHTDFIQLDHYGPFPFSALPRDYNAATTKFNRRVLEQYGILPWEIGFYSKKLTDAFRDHDWKQVRTSAAILAHYVNAASASAVPSASPFSKSSSTRPMALVTWARQRTRRLLAAAKAKGILAVEMEAAALYAFAAANKRRVLCLAHVTNAMGRVDEDFEKGEADGTAEALAVFEAIVEANGH